MQNQDKQQEDRQSERALAQLERHDGCNLAHSAMFLEADERMRRKWRRGCRAGGNLYKPDGCTSLGLAMSIQLINSVASTPVES
jgi:hypothetical protein